MTTLLEEYAALALDKQTTLERLTDTAAAWFVDQNIGQLTLGDEHFTIHWLGTYSHHSGSWLWAWANSFILIGNGKTSPVLHKSIHKIERD